MPLYEFWCECGFRKGIIRKMGKSPKHLICPECGFKMYRDFQTNIHVFEPFVSSDFNGKPIEVKSSKHRDQLCKEYNVTPDSHKYHRRKEVPTVVEQLDYREIKHELENYSDEQLQRKRELANIERGDPERGEIPTREIPIQEE